MDAENKMAPTPVAPGVGAEGTDSRQAARPNSQQAGDRDRTGDPELGKIRAGGESFSIGVDGACPPGCEAPRLTGTDECAEHALPARREGDICICGHERKLHPAVSGGCAHGARAEQDGHGRRCSCCGFILFAFEGRIPRSRMTFGELCLALERAELEEDGANAHVVSVAAHLTSQQRPGEWGERYRALQRAVEEALRAQARKREARAALEAFGKDGG